MGITIAELPFSWLPAYLLSFLPNLRYQQADKPPALSGHVCFLMVLRVETYAMVR